MKTICVHSGQAGFHDNWIKFIKKHGYQANRINLLSNTAIHSIYDCSAIMWHLSMLPAKLQAASYLLNAIEHNQTMPVFPNWKTRWHFENKIAQYYLFGILDIPTPKSYVFWYKNEALNYINSTSFPLVSKLARGASSINVEIMRNLRRAKQKVNSAFSGSGILSEPGYYPIRRRHGSDKIRNTLANILVRFYAGFRYVFSGKYPPLPRDWWMPEKNYVLFQDLLEGNMYDTRITVIGDRAFAFRRFNRPNDFRASGGGKIDHNPDEIDMNAVAMAFRISKMGGFQSMAYDFLYDATKTLCVSEMCFGYQNVAVHDCPGYWDSHLNWHEDSMWPEEAHVIDFIRHIEN
ncbi:MAG: hypothetical protein KAT09_00140 [Candidatus Aegiribacteria sp.]|nr:hypothetical protein [Candidatus Aegiribacteria sp.]